MIEPKLMERQRGLFPVEMNWQQLPAHIRRQVTALLATLCIELVEQTRTLAGKETHEPNED